MVFRTYQTFALALVVMFFAACGGCGDPDKSDPCDNVTCDRGECSNGVCANKDSCEVEEDCVEGYNCNDDAVCEVGETCTTDADCSRGVCDTGVCINADICVEDDNCIVGFSCTNGECQEDPCSGVVCERGVCDQSDGECVNETVCTRETETEDCLDGFVCYNQECSDETAVCADLDCTRGECSFEEQACVNGETCDSDTNCLRGFFCNDAGQCQANACDANMIMCNRGVCDAETGDCLDADPCFDETECVDGNFCVDNSCIDMITACEACTGNQVCNYDGVALAVSCREDPNGCTTALDCRDDRVCNAGVCEDPSACIPDALEPNDTAADRVDWHATQLNNGVIDATLCGGDQDYFLFDTQNDPEFTGTLLVNVTVNPIDVGLGNVTVELFNKDNAMVGNGTSMNDGVVQIAYPVDVVGIGEYTIRVADSGDVTTAGLRYDLFVDLVDANTVTACQNAPELVATASGNTSAGASTTLGSACVFNGQPPEDIYYFNLAERSYVTVAVTNVTFNATVGIRTACEVDGSELTCENGGGINEDETIGVALDPGTYYIVVQGSAVGEAGTYDISLTTEPVICTQADNMCAGNDAMVCNARGTGFNTEICMNGCDVATGLCIREVGDVCFTSIDANGGYTGTIPLGTLLNDYDPGDMSCITQPFFSATDGPDAAFNLTLGAGEAVEINLETADFEDVAIYITDDCSDVATTCIVGNDGFSDADLIYTNNSALPEDLFIIIDANSAFVGDATVTINAGPVICTPGALQCNGADLETCNQSGTGYNARTCLGGCDPNGPACNPPPNDLCAGAIDATAGVSIVGQANDEYADDYDPAGACGTGGGPEGVWFVTATAGQLLDISYNTTGFTGNVYIATDCNDVGNTCAVNDDAFGQAQIYYSIPADGTYYIFADTSFQGSTGTYDLDISLVTPVCTPGDSSCVSATDVQVCRVDGSGFDVSTCALGCDAVGGNCNGDVCSTAFDASAGGQFVGTIENFTNVYNPGSNGCTGFNANGMEAVYFVTGQPNDIVTVSLDASYDTSLYAVTDCADLGTCLAGSDDFGGAENIQFILPGSGTAYIMADAFSANPTGQYTLDVTVQTPDCLTPGQPVGCISANTLQYCNELGLLTDYQCATTCAGAACDDPRGELCFDAIPVADGGSYSGDYSAVTNQVDPGTSTCITETFNQQDGPDTIYTLTLNPGDVLDAQLTTNAFGSGLYLLTDCDDAENTCVFAETDATRLQYFDAVGGTYFLVVDSDSEFSSDPFTLDISIYPGACQPNENSCDPNSNVASECNADGTSITTQSCANGCSGDYCGPPAALYDTCATAQPIAGSQQFLEDFTRFADDYDPGFASCTGGSTGGPDMVYSVSLAPNEVIDITADDLGNFGTPAIYIITDCMDPAGSCLAGDSGSVARVAYAATVAETVNVVVDNSSSAPDPDVLIDIEVRPADCMAGQESCLDATTRQFCNPFFELETENCQFGCTAGVCDPPPNDLCAGAIDATAGGTFVGNIEDYANDYDPAGAANCTGFAEVGPEGVWAVNALAGQILTVSMDANFDAAVYVATDCADVTNTCGAGDDSGNPEEFSFSIPADGTYYIFADSFSSFATGSFTLDISLVTPICTPNDSICSSATNVDVCRADGSGYDSFTCATASCDATNNECAGDTCASAIDATAGGTFTGSYDGSIVADYDTTGGGCTGFATVGRDIAYQVDLLANQTVTATLNSPQVDTALYILSDCADPVNTCLDGDDAFPSGETVSYTSMVAETVFVIADSWDDPGDGTYTLDITVQ